jgi:hypothetical protein
METKWGKVRPVQVWALVYRCQKGCVKLYAGGARALGVTLENCDIIKVRNELS